MDRGTQRDRLPSRGTLRRTGRSTWWLQWKHKGKPAGQTIKASNRAAAERAAAKAITLVRASIIDGSYDPAPDGQPGFQQVRTHDLPLTNIWECYVASVNRPDPGPTTLQQYSYQFGYFARWMAATHPHCTTLGSVTQAIAWDFVATLRPAKSAGTVNKYVNLLRLVFQTVGESTAGFVNPWNNIRHQVSRGRGGGREPFSQAELGVIFARSTGELRTLCFLGYHTGMRLGDCCLLEWGEVNMTATSPSIRRVPLKTRRRTGRTVCIPIHVELLNHLRAVRDDAHGKYVCPEFARLYLEGTRRHVDARSSAVSDKVQYFLRHTCGIDTQWTNTGHGTGKHAAVRKGFHSFRHGWVTRAKESGIDRATVEAVVGWGSPAMERVYTHISEDHIAAAVSRMPSVQGDQPIESSGVSSLSDRELHSTLKALLDETRRRRGPLAENVTSFSTPCHVASATHGLKVNDTP